MERILLCGSIKPPHKLPFSVLKCCLHQTAPPDSGITRRNSQSIPAPATKAALFLIIAHSSPAARIYPRRIHTPLPKSSDNPPHLENVEFNIAVLANRRHKPIYRPDHTKFAMHNPHKTLNQVQHLKENMQDI
jgi:hypothetical protein